MAANSAACKSWSITIVAAILIFMADKGKPEFAVVAAMPVALFFGLDVYYLALEYGFRSSYEDFVQRLHVGSLRPEDAFVVRPQGPLAKGALRAARSTSVWPFHTALLLMVVAGWWMVQQKSAVATAPPPASASSGREVTVVTTTTTTTTTTGTAAPGAVAVTAPATTPDSIQRTPAVTVGAGQGPSTPGIGPPADNGGPPPGAAARPDAIAAPPP